MATGCFDLCSRIGRRVSPGGNVYVQTYNVTGSQASEFSQSRVQPIQINSQIRVEAEMVETPGDQYIP